MPLRDVSCVIAHNQLHIVGGMNGNFYDMNTHYIIELSAIIPQFSFNNTIMAIMAMNE